MIELQTAVGAVFLTLLTIGNIVEIGIPTLKTWFQEQFLLRDVASSKNKKSGSLIDSYDTDMSEVWIEQEVFLRHDDRQLGARLPLELAIDVLVGPFAHTAALAADKDRVNPVVANQPPPIPIPLAFVLVC